MHYYYDQILVLDKERKHFNTLPLDECRKGNILPLDQITASCTSYLKEVFTLYFLEDYESWDPSEPETDDFDVDSRQWVVYYEILGKEQGESIISAYQRKLTEILILDPWTWEEVRKQLLATSHKATLLYDAILQMQEDDLDGFFSQTKFSWKRVTSTEIGYLRDKLANASSIEFDDMLAQDNDFKTLIDKLASEDDKPLDYQYHNLWNKKVAWWLRTPEQHMQVIDQIIATLELKDISAIIEHFSFDEVFRHKIYTKGESLSAT